MNSKTFLFLAALFATLSLGAQTENTEIKAVSAEAYAKQQDAYMPSFRVDGRNTRVRNVILLIGDGMGHGAVNLAMYANGGALTMTNLKTFGLVRTQSADNFTTDSAASGTAYATGHKTNNGFVGKDTARVNLPNLPEILTPLGYACGVVSTDDLNGATPASFFAHQAARGDKEEIWADLPASALKFASAGTQSVFESMPILTQEAIRKTFTLVYDPADPAVKTSDRLVYLPPSVQLDRGDYLPATTQMAIDYLSARSRKGFFLMVEGARIDKHEHANELSETVAETLDFDKAIEAAVRFAEKDGHTLVLISADHETGATLLFGADMETGHVRGVFASKSHTPMMVPLFAYGPHSRDFGCTQENSDVALKILGLLGARK